MGPLDPGVLYADMLPQAVSRLEGFATRNAGGDGVVHMLGCGKKGVAIGYKRTISDTRSYPGILNILGMDKKPSIKLPGTRN